MTIYRIGEERHYTHRRHNPKWPLYIRDPKEALMYIQTEHQPVYKSVSNKAYIKMSEQDLQNDINKIQQHENL